MEKLVVKEYPLQRNQHAYETGKSTETTLRNVVTRIGVSTEYKELSLGTFLDTEGAFDKTSFDVMIQAAGGHGTEPTICIWVCSTLKSKNIITTLSRETLLESTARGRPQVDVFSLFLWSLFVDELLWDLNDNGYYRVGYADHIAILINGKVPQTVSEVLQTAPRHNSTAVRQDKFVHRPYYNGNNTFH
jgi:hypothetical protein